MTDDTNPPGPAEEPSPDPLPAIRAAAQQLATAVNTLPKMPRLELPRMPALADPAPDPRHIWVQVRTAPMPLEPTETHTYRDERGLSWQTYGQEHDFGTDRLLEVINEDADVIASYAPGTWLHVRFPSYIDATERAGEST